MILPMIVILRMAVLIVVVFVNVITRLLLHRLVKVKDNNVVDSLVWDVQRAQNVSMIHQMIVFLVKVVLIVSEFVNVLRIVLDEDKNAVDSLVFHVLRD
jgi:hypothetical protein